MYKCTWREKYITSLEEELNSTQIMMLRGVNKKEALRIRKEALLYCRNNGISVVGQKVPAEAVFAVTGKNIDYYHSKMQLEAKAKENN